MMSVKKIFAPMIGMLLLISAIVLFARPHTSIPQKTVTKTIVHTDKIQSMTSRRSLTFPGLIRSANQATLSFSISGRLAKRFAPLGMSVKKGEPLAALEPLEFQNGVNLAKTRASELKIRFNQIERDFERVRQLKDVKAATVEELEHIRSEKEAIQALYESARIALREARRKLSETQLNAPFTGSITKVAIEPGEWVHPGKPVFEISGSTEMEVEIEVPETLIGKFNQGDLLQVALPFQDNRAIKGTIFSISKATSQTGGLFSVVVKLNSDTKILPGFTAEVILPVIKKNLLTVPFSAILNPGSSTPTIYRLEDKRVHELSVTLGEMIKDRIAISGRIEKGDEVIIKGQTFLSGGDEVEVTR